MRRKSYLNARIRRAPDSWKKKFIFNHTASREPLGMLRIFRNNIMHHRFMRKSSTGIVLAVFHDTLSSDLKPPSISLVSRCAFFFSLCDSQEAMAVRTEKSLSLSQRPPRFLVRFNMRDAAVRKRVQRMCGLHMYERLIYRISGTSPALLLSTVLSYKLRKKEEEEEVNFRGCVRFSGFWR